MNNGWVNHEAEGMSRSRWQTLLPDEPWQSPDRRSLIWLVQHYGELRAELLEELERLALRRREELRRAREEGAEVAAAPSLLCWLVLLVAHVRDRGALDALTLALSLEESWVDDDVVHALVRLGAPVLPRMRELMRDREVGTLTRGRAALVAALVAGAEPEASVERAEVIATFELLLARGEATPAFLLDRVAVGLAHLRVQRCLPLLDRLCTSGRLGRGGDLITLDGLHRLMRGTASLRAEAETFSLLSLWLDEEGTSDRFVR